MLSSTSLKIVFLASNKNMIHTWLISKGKTLCHQKKELNDQHSSVGASNIQALIQSAYGNAKVRANVRCEDRSMDGLQKGYSPDEKAEKKPSHPPQKRIL